MKRAAPGHLFLITVICAVLLLFFWNDSEEDTYVFSLPSIEKEQLHLAVGQRIDECLKTI